MCGPEALWLAANSRRAKSCVDGDGVSIRC